jgi:tetratricopeptide (TPR) repeat protein
MTVIVGSGQDKGKMKRRLLIIGGVVALFLVAAAAGVLLRWLQTKDDPPPAPKLPSIVEDVQNSRAEGNISVDREIEDALATPSINDETRYLLYLQQGHTFADRQQWDKAIEAYGNAEKLRRTYEVAELLAETYVNAGDTARAVEYYRKAIDLIPQDSPVREANKEVLESTIRELEAAP